MGAKMKRVSLYIPNGLYNRITESAQENKRSINQEITRELEEYRLLIQDESQIENVMVVKVIMKIRDFVKTIIEKEDHDHEPTAIKISNIPL